MKRILVIEDEDAIRQNVADLLELEDYAVQAARDGAEGIRMAREFHPDLVLCDVMMPGPDGYQVLEQLRREAETALVPFVFLTAKAEKRDVRRGLDLGADDYLTKPFTQAELLSAIEARLRRGESLKQYVDGEVEALSGSIASSLPHELLTPLNIVIGMAETLQTDAERLSAGEIVDLAMEIHAAGGQLHRLVRRYLLWTELELIRASPRRLEGLRRARLGSVRPVILEAAQRPADEAARGSDLECEVEDGEVGMEADSIESLVEELVGNACKFSDPETAIRILGRRTAAGYELAVEDQGRGMTAEQIARVGACRQFDRSLHEQAGVGLGLAIARRLVEFHGGEFRIDSAPGAGARFTARLRFPEAPAHA